MTVSATAIAINRLLGEVRSLQLEVAQLHEQLGDLRDDLQRQRLAKQRKKP